MVIERSEIVWAAEDDVGRVLGLSDAPVIATERLESGTYRATAASRRACSSVTARLSATTWAFRQLLTATIALSCSSSDTRAALSFEASQL